MRPAPKHNWTKETMGRCAQTHMEQITNAHFNMANKKQREAKVAHIIEHYFRIECSLNKAR